MISGANLADADAVFFGGALATSLTFDYSTQQLTAVSPPGTGTIYISVQAPGGISAPSSTGFTYSGIPEVATISQATGSTAGA